MNPEQSHNKSNDDDYARALAKMAELDYQIGQKAEPESKHFISKKMLVYIILSLIISVITLIIGHFMTKNNTKKQDDETINQLLQTTKDIRNLEN